MGRKPFNSKGHWREYPPYVPKVLDNRKSLIASVNGRKASLNNLIESSTLTEDERLIVERIIEEFDNLRDRIKENNGGENDEQDKTKEPVFGFGGARTTFTSF